MQAPIFFDSWSSLLRVIVVGSAAYAALVLILRASGKRTLSKMNAFDLVITIALGSTFATVILNKSVALAEGVVALTLLVCLQYAITWLSVRSTKVRRLVKSEPTLLVHNGVFLADAMRRQRVTNEEVLSAMREQGVGKIADVGCVVLETDGSLTVVTDDCGLGR